MVEKASEQKEQLNALLEKYRGTKGSVIPVLQQAQEIYGYLPKEVLIEISSKLEVPISQIYGVVTFYAQFHLEPRGRNIIRSCQGTACHVRGAKAVLKAIQDKLGLKEGQTTTPDLKFTLETVACIAHAASRRSSWSTTTRTEDLHRNRSARSSTSTRKPDWRN